MKILIDNGHGCNTPGKCSPDKSLMEYAYCRDIAANVVNILRGYGYDASLLVAELQDIPLKERVSRVNFWCQKLGSRNVLCVSIHCNASGSDGKWHDAKGWSVFVSDNASKSSIRMCNIMWDEVGKLEGHKRRRPSPSQNYWTKSLAMTRDTNCPAVLTENYFQDNREDVEWLLSPEGHDAVVNLHVNSIIRYCNEANK